MSVIIGGDHRVEEVLQDGGVEPTDESGVDGRPLLIVLHDLIPEIVLTEHEGEVRLPGIVRGGEVVEDDGNPARMLRSRMTTGSGPSNGLVRRLRVVPVEPGEAMAERGGRRRVVKRRGGRDGGAARVATLRVAGGSARRRRHTGGRRRGDAAAAAAMGSRRWRQELGLGS